MYLNLMLTSLRLAEDVSYPVFYWRPCPCQCLNIPIVNQNFKLSNCNKALFSYRIPPDARGRAHELARCTTTAAQPRAQTGSLPAREGSRPLTIQFSTSRSCSLHSEIRLPYFLSPVMSGCFHRTVDGNARKQKWRGCLVSEASHWFPVSSLFSGYCFISFRYTLFVACTVAFALNAEISASLKAYKGSIVYCRWCEMRLWLRQP